MYYLGPSRALSAVAGNLLKSSRKVVFHNKPPNIKTLGSIFVCQTKPKGNEYLEGRLCNLIDHKGKMFQNGEALYFGTKSKGLCIWEVFIGMFA